MELTLILFQWVGFFVVASFFFALGAVVFISALSHIHNYWLFNKVDRKIMLRAMKIAFEEQEKKEKEEMS